MTTKTVGHTPGPWEVTNCREAHYNTPRTVYNEQGHAIASIAGRTPGGAAEWAANGNLIAAAPDLLVAAVAFVADFQAYMDSDDYDLPDCSGLVDAIAKARGNR